MPLARAAELQSDVLVMFALGGLMSFEAKSW